MGMAQLGMVVLALAAAVAPALAAWPGERPVTLVVPFPAGGSSDSIGRVLAQKLPQQLGGRWVIENKPGATGTIGAAFVTRSAADGYTLLVSSLGPFVIAPHLVKGVPYDALQDFEPITIAVQAANVLVVPARSSHRSVADLLAGARRAPGALSFASAGNGTSDHLSTELFWQQTGTRGQHVPYRGNSPVVSELLGGQVDAAFVNINSVLPHVRSGRIRALAVAADRRSALLPGVPTLQEQGVRGAEVQSWQAVAAPRGLPSALRNRLREAIATVLNEPEVRDQLVAQGFEVVADTPERFSRYQASEFARWKRLIEARGIRAD